MCDRLCEVYDDGRQPCLSAILLLGSARDVFHDRVEALYQDWIGAIAQVCWMPGLTRRRRGSGVKIERSPSRDR